MSTWRIGVADALMALHAARSSDGRTRSRSAREDVQLGREREVLGPLGDGPLELDEGGGGTGLEVEQGAGDQVGEDPDAVDRDDLEAGLGQERGDLVRGEPVPGVFRGRVRRSSSARACGKWPAMARAMTAACRWATSSDRVPPGRSTSRIVARAAAGSSTTSSTPWQSTTSALPSTE